MNRLRASVLSTFVVMFALCASGEVRLLEAVGTAPIDTSGRVSGVPRDIAINGALREAVVRVAQEFLADRPIDEAPAEPGDDGDERGGLESRTDQAPDSQDPLSPTTEDPEDTASGDFLDLEAILGKKMVPYTLRFRVIEDRGRQPALFAEDPSVREEYVVIVEVQVDVERVRAKLVTAGLIPAGESTEGSDEVRLVIEGLTVYPAYLAVRSLLEGALGARGIIPVEMSRGLMVLDVETRASAVEFLEELLTLAPPEIEIVPVAGGGNTVRVAVNWVPEAERSSDERSEESGGESVSGELEASSGSDQEPAGF